MLCPALLIPFPPSFPPFLPPFLPYFPLSLSCLPPSLPPSVPFLTAFHSLCAFTLLSLRPTLPSSLLPSHPHSYPPILPPTFPPTLKDLRCRVLVQAARGRCVVCCCSGEGRRVSVPRVGAIDLLTPTIDTPDFSNGWRRRRFWSSANPVAAGALARGAHESPRTSGTMSASAAGVHHSSLATVTLGPAFAIPPFCRRSRSILLLMPTVVLRDVSL